MNIEEKLRKQEKKFAYTLTGIFLLIGAWFIKQIGISNKEKATGVQQPMDAFDKAGCLVVIVLGSLIALGIIIGVLVGIYEFVSNNKLT